MPSVAFSHRLATFAACSLLAIVNLACQQAAPVADDGPPLPANYQPQVGQPGKDVIWVPTPQVLVDALLDLAELTPHDYLIDLGSGDGRAVITAAQRGARAHGVELDEHLVAYARREARLQGVAKQATFEQADIFETDFSDASVVMLFLLPSLNLKLRPALLEMQPGTRIVSNEFDMGEWAPDQTIRIDEPFPNPNYQGHLWIVPAHVGGVWVLEDGRQLEIAQQFQTFTGFWREGTGRQEATAITQGHVRGAGMTFHIGDVQVQATVQDDTLTFAPNPLQASRAQRLR